VDACCYCPFQISPLHRKSRRNFISLPGKRHIELALKSNSSNTATRKEERQCCEIIHAPPTRQLLLQLDEQPHMNFLLGAHSFLVLAHCWRSLPYVSTYSSTQHSCSVAHGKACFDFLQRGRCRNLQYQSSTARSSFFKSAIAHVGMGSSSLSTGQARQNDGKLSKK